MFRNFVEHVLSLLNAQPDPPAREFVPVPPEKEHRLDQLVLAQEFNGVKEIAQALEIDDQDKGGIPNPVEYITQLKQEVAMPANTAILVKGQRFVAPEGFKIKQVRPDGKVLWFGSIYKGRKLNAVLQGSKFSLVRK